MSHTKFEISDREINGEDYFAVIEPLHLSVSIYDGPEKYEEDLARFSREQRHVFACHWYLCEVNNGGHNQFYYNSTGIVWKDAREGFVALGIPEIAAIIDQSAQRLEGNPSLIREERQEQMDRTEPRFDDLDDMLFELEKKINLDEKLIAYIRANRTQFLFSGLVENL